jgi:hypothetical protein
MRKPFLDKIESPELSNGNFFANYLAVPSIDRALGGENFFRIFWRI